MNNWALGSFFTMETPYQQIVNEYLIPSAEKFGIPLDLAPIPNKGNWYINVAEKPGIILDMLEGGYETLVFLDADATIEQYPKLFDEIPEEYDIAFHTLSWKQWYGYEKDRAELLTGTMFFRNNDKVKALCRAWYKQAQNTQIWEQKVLENIIDNFDVKVYNLPLEYCYMKSRPRNQEPLVKLNPVILHHQVSRELKRSMK